MDKKPNVILINCDDMGYGDLGCYGSEKNDTPTIDQLAKEGMKLTSFYTASPVCSPSRAALLTGCYPARVNINGVLFPGEDIGLNKEEYTLGNLFKDNGYATKIVGKWHVGDQKEFLPQNYGFNEYYGLPYSNDMGQQVNPFPDKHLPPLPLIEGNEVIEEQPDQRSITARYTEQCRSFIRENAEQPFFLYMAHMHMHLPHYCIESFMEDSRNGEYGGCISEVDWSVKSLIYELKKQGIYDDTIIVFTSDNGSRADHGASNEPLRGTKFTTLEGGQRVPGIIKWTGKVEAGSVSDEIASHIDLLPTFASILGAKVGDKTIDGLDITEQWFEGKKVREDFVYMLASKINVNIPTISAYRKGPWKLHLKRRIENNEREFTKELYNLVEDISEENNLYDQYPDIVAELTAAIESCEMQFGDEMKGIVGSEIRIAPRVENPEYLTEYDENHPYVCAMYDKNDRG